MWVSRYIHWHFTFSEHLGGGFSLYTLTFHLQWASGWGFLAIYTDISPSVSIWVGVSRYIHWHFTFSDPLGGGFSLYTLTFHLQWESGWGFLAIYTDISPSVTHWVGVSRYIHWHFTFSENLGGGFSLYTDISTSVSHWVMVSRYIYWHFTFSESLGGGFSLYTQIFHLQWASGWGFLAIYTDISPSVSHWVGVSRYTFWHFTFSESLGGGFSPYILLFHLQWVTGWEFLAIYTLTFHLQWVTGWGFLAIYTAISSSVSHWVGVSRHIYCYFIYSESLGGCFSLYIHWHFTSVSIWVGVSRYIHWYFTFSEHLGGGFSLYTLIFHLQWASGWGFLAIYTDISPSVSIWVGVSRYIHWYFTFSEHLGGGFSLYTLIFHLQWASGWGFLAIYTDISPSVSIWVGVSRNIHWYFTFSEHMGGGFSVHTLTFHLQWASGWRFLAIYTDISPSVSIWVGVSCYIYRYFTFCQPLGGGFSLYILTFHLQWVTGWGSHWSVSICEHLGGGFSLYTLIFHLQWASGGWYFTFSEYLCGGFSVHTLTFHLQWASGWRFLAIYTDISPSVSIWVGVSCYIYRYFTFCQPLGGGFSLYILTFHLQWVTGWWFLAIYTVISSSVSHWVGVSRYIYTDISPSVSHWVGVSRNIYCYFIFSESLGGGFSPYILLFHLQWVTGWVFLAIYTLTFHLSEHLGGGFSLYTLIFHLQWASGWGFLAIYTDISPSVSIWVGVSRYIHWHFTFSEHLGGGFSLYTLIFHLQWASGWRFLAIYTDISPSVSIWVGVSRYIHWHFTFSEHLGGGFSLYKLIFHLQWASGWGFLGTYTDISPSVSIWVEVSRYIHWHFTFSEHLGGGFLLYIQIFHLLSATGWWFLAIYTDISPSVSHWVGVSRYIHWYFTFSEHLGGGFSLYIQIFHLQWASGWGFLAIYTDISHSVSHWVGVSRYTFWHFTFSESLGGVSRHIFCYFIFSESLGGSFSLYIHWHFTFSESLGGGFSPYILLFHLRWVTGWGFLAIYTLTFHLSEHLGGGFSLYKLIFHLQWASGWGFLAIYTDILPSVSIWVGVSRYIHWYFTFSEHLGGGFSLYTLIFHLQWASGWGFLAIYTDISPSVSIWVGVSRYIHWYFTFSEHLGGGFSLYTLTFHLQWASGWGFLAIYTDISPSVSIWVGVSRYIHWHFTFSEHLGGGFSLYTLIFHLQWVSGWGFLGTYTDISPSVSIWVDVSRYIHWHFTFSEHLGGGFLLYIQIFHILSATGWGFLAIHSDISPSVSHWVGVSRHIYCYFIFSESLGGSFSLYIHWHFTFSESLGGAFSPYILLFHLQWVTGWGFLAIYTLTFHLSEHLGGGFSLYKLIFHLQWASGWGFLAIYTDISPSVSIWVGVSRYIHWHFTFSEHLGGGFSLYTLIFYLQWASGWGVLAIYTDISPSVSIWVGVSRYIHWYFSFSEHLGGGFSLYTLIFHLQWASGWGFLAIYTDISLSVSIWVGVSRYIHWYFTFSEHLGGGFSLYTLIFHLQWASGWGFLAIYTDISPSVSICVGVSRYIHWHFTFSESLCGGFSLYTDISPSVSHCVGVSRYILTFHLQWVTVWGFLAIYTDISPSVSVWVGVSRDIHWHFTFSEHLGGCFSLYTLTK